MNAICLYQFKYYIESEGNSIMYLALFWSLFNNVTRIQILWEIGEEQEEQNNYVVSPARKSYREVGEKKELWEKKQ